MAGNINKPENYLYNTEEVGGMRFNPPYQWNHKPNVGWFGLVKLLSTLNFVDGHMIEIGTYAAESTAMFASSGKFKKIHTIDPYNFPQGYQVQMEARINTRYWDNIKFYKEYSYNIHDYFKNGVFDFVYIDGDHSGEAVSRDIELYLPKVKKGRYIAGHDYLPEKWPEVVHAVNSFFPKDKIWLFEDWSWMVRV